MRPPRLPAPDDLFAARFHVLRLLSSGAVGAVFAVRDLRTGRHRALKILLPSVAFDDETRERFDLEARVTATVRSPNVVEVLDAGHDDETGSPYLVMELLDGESLGAVVGRGALPLGQALDVLRQLARGLDAMHAAGVVHRDVKPENVILVRGGEPTQRAVLVDLGVAKVVAAGPAATTRALGTPLYMSPEQIEGRGDVDGRADVYALGHLAFAMLCGKPYFAEEHERGAVHRVLLDTTRGLPDAASARASRHGVALPRGFDAWFAAVTARDRRVRPASAGRAVVELDRALRGDARRRRIPAVVAGVALLAVVGASLASERREATSVRAEGKREVREERVEETPIAVAVPARDEEPPASTRPPDEPPPRAIVHARSAGAKTAPAKPSAAPAARPPLDPTDVR